MKKIFVCIISLFLVSILSSCEENENEKVNKVYFSKTKIYGSDSIFSGVTVYIGYTDGHKYMYHIYNGGKRKGDFVTYHMVDECNKCIANNKKTAPK